MLSRLTLAHVASLSKSLMLLKMSSVWAIFFEAWLLRLCLYDSPFGSIPVPLYWEMAIAPG